jgi:hypothetical protein
MCVVQCSSGCGVHAWQVSAQMICVLQRLIRLIKWLFLTARQHDRMKRHKDDGAPPPPPLPPPLTQTGSPFYVNPFSQESTWDMPAEFRAAELDGRLHTL